MALALGPLVRPLMDMLMNVLTHASVRSALPAAACWRRLGLIAVLLATLALRPAAPARAAVGAWDTTGPAERVWAVAVHPANDQEVLAAGESGVWKTVDGGGSWTKISATPVRQALAMDPHAAGTLYGISADRKSILKSADGGVSWAPVYTGTGATQINAVLVDPNVAGAVYAGVTAADGLAQVLRSTDAGATWAAVLPANLRGAGGIGQTAVTTLAAVQGIPGLVLAGEQVYHGGLILKSADGGATWSVAYNGALTPLAAPNVLAAAGTSAATATIYAYFSIMGAGSLIRSTDGGGTWANLPALPVEAGPTGRQVTGLLVHPAQPQWLYLAMWAQLGGAPPPGPVRAGVFASSDGGQTWAEVGYLEPLAQPVSGPQGLGLALASRTLYAATGSGVYRYTIAWPVLPAFQPYYDAHDGYRLLGTAISLQAQAGGRPSQYFEKGRLEDHSSESPDPNWQLMYGLLVDELHTSQAMLPVGGDVSSLTYAGLHALADPSQRVAPPPGYAGSGTMAVAEDGTTFVPFTADLSGAPGHLVPGMFWRYLNRQDLFPAGWLHDVGLPITPAREVLVTKYLPQGPAQRTILVQAFQRAILTDDPLNPPDWRVERANVGSDYRKFFPDRVGP